MNGQGPTADPLTASAALLTAGSGEARAAWVHADFELIDAAGRVLGREEALQALAGPDGSQAQPETRLYGDLALVTRRAAFGGAGVLVTVEAWLREAAGWRALVVHRNVVATAPTPHPALVQRPPDAPAPACDNPLRTIPYEPTSRDGAELIESFQALETAVTRNDAETWVRHVAEEFVVYRTGQYPTTKDGRAKALAAARAVNNETFVAAIEWMDLRVAGDAALMRADHVMPGVRRPPYRATRIWTRRGGVWQMALSQQTTRSG